MIYQFESGSFSDWTLSGPIEGPEGADFDALMREFAGLIAARGDWCEVRYDGSIMREIVGGEPYEKDYLNGDDDWFSEWLVHRKGFRRVECERVCVDDIAEIAIEESDE